MPALSLDALESFYVGGHAVPIPEGPYAGDEMVVGAMYVQRLVPSDRRFPLPVILVHGGMSTGVTWETTLDGREGWQTLFPRAGFETLVIDQFSRGRSAPDLRSLCPHTAGSAPPAGPVNLIGKSASAFFSRGGGRFPDSDLHAYASQIWPDFGILKAAAAGHSGLSDPLALEPMTALLDRIGRAVLITHSQGGHLGWRTAIARPDKVAAIFSIEPGVTSPGLDDPDFPDIPVRIMWGDNLREDAPVLSMHDLRTAQAIAARNPKVTVDHLPADGISGNGHKLMQDDNSAELAARIMQWLRSLDL